MSCPRLLANLIHERPPRSREVEAFDSEGTVVAGKHDGENSLRHPHPRGEQRTGIEFGFMIERAEHVSICMDLFYETGILESAKHGLLSGECSLEVSASYIERMIVTFLFFGGYQSVFRFFDSGINESYVSLRGSSAPAKDKTGDDGSFGSLRDF